MTKIVIIIGIISIIISIIAWLMDLYGFVYSCPYCQTERTVIGIIGIAMIFNNYKNLYYYFSINLIALIGIITAINQQFLGIAKISSGKIESVFSPPIYENPFLLSSAALVYIPIQITLLNLHRFPKLRDIFRD